MGSRNIVPFLSIVKEGWEKTLFFAKFFCFLHVTNTYLITPVQVNMIPPRTYLKFFFMINNSSVPILQVYGPSMLPAIDLTPAIFFGERISTRFGKVACGDIVTLRTPQNPRRYITKRVVGMEGDSVTYVSNPENSEKHETVVVWSISYKNSSHF